MMQVIQTVGMIAAIALPFWNIPLVVRMIKRKSSDDVSLYWALGVWACLLLMVPSGIVSSDIVWRAFNATNFLLFSLVTGTVIYYRIKHRKQ